MTLSFFLQHCTFCPLTCTLCHHLSSSVYVLPLFVLLPVSCLIICPLTCALCHHLSSYLYIVRSFVLFLVRCVYPAIYPPVCCLLRVMAHYLHGVFVSSPVCIRSSLRAHTFLCLPTGQCACGSVEASFLAHIPQGIVDLFRWQLGPWGGCLQDLTARSFVCHSVFGLPARAGTPFTERNMNNTLPLVS